MISFLLPLLFFFLSLYVERIQMGLWPSVLGLASFFWYGIRRTPPSYVMKNPNLSGGEKLLARQLTSTLSARRLPLVVMGALALFPMPGVESSAFGGIAGGLTGALLGYMWTRSPHLMLLNGLLVAAEVTYMAQRPTWTLKFQAFRFARAWEDGEFIRAREWLHVFEAQSRRLTKEEQNWTHVSMALAEMACGRTTVALRYANMVDLSTLVLKRDLEDLRKQFADEWKEARLKRDQDAKETVSQFTSPVPFVDPSQLEAIKRYQQSFHLAPWRIMNDEKIASLFFAVFRSGELTPPQMQKIILDNYKGLFNFDPSYERGYIATGAAPLTLPSNVKDNPLQ
jgi:hypothetical protein